MIVISKKANSKLKSGKAAFLTTVFPHIVAAATILF